MDPAKVTLPKTKKAINKGKPNSPANDKNNVEKIAISENNVNNFFFMPLKSAIVPSIGLITAIIILANEL